MDLEARLLEIRDRLAKSTPGPWEVQRFDNEGGYISYQVEAFQDYDENSGPTAWCSELTNPKYARPNADLIAHAPTDLALLLSLVKEYRAALDGIANIQNLDWPDRIYAAQAIARQALKRCEEVG